MIEPSEEEIAAAADLGNRLAVREGLADGEAFVVGFDETTMFVLLPSKEETWTQPRLTADEIAQYALGRALEELVSMLTDAIAGAHPVQ